MFNFCVFLTRWFRSIAGGPRSREVVIVTQIEGGWRGAHPVWGPPILVRRWSSGTPKSRGRNTRRGLGMIHLVPMFQGSGGAILVVGRWEGKKGWPR